MVFSISYYPNSAAGVFGKPAGAKGICSCHLPDLEKIAKEIGKLPISQNIENKRIYFNGKNQRLLINEKPYHLSLEADSPKELSDLAFGLSEQLTKAGFSYYSLPFDYSQIEKIK